MEVVRAIEMNKERRGAKEHFAGTVWLQEMLIPSELNRLRASLVFFEPGARTNWHKHPEFRILYVVAGKGRIRSSNGTGNEETFEIAAADVVHIGTEKHRHGAVPDSFMMHIAINTGETCWLEEFRTRSITVVLAEGKCCRFLHEEGFAHRTEVLVFGRKG